MNYSNPFRTVCRANWELLGILAAAEEGAHVSRLYWINEDRVKDDPELKAEFTKKRDEIKNQTNEKI